MPQAISITAYSTALFSTWVFVEPYGVMFDCGDGASSALLQKSRKVKHLFVSHADRDHLAGLFQFNQLNGREDLTIYYPKDSGSFPAMQAFTAKFDPHISGTRWKPISPGDDVQLNNNRSVRAIENRHVTNDESLIKSLSFVLESTRKKLRAKYSEMAGPEIAKLKSQLAEEEMFEELRDKELVYSGDTPVESDGRYSDARILIHEATFLRREELRASGPDRNCHSSLDAVMEMVADSNIENLILGHFSSRYSDDEINMAIEREKSRCGIKVPVFAVYPGQVLKLKI